MPAKSEGKNSPPKPAGDLFGYLEKYDRSWWTAAYFLGTTESLMPLLRRNLSAVLAGI
jgi:hypothetical protein